jgi:IS30 family transposase
MTQYTHFDARMRNLIARKLNVDGLSFGVIAAHLGVAKSAVRNEVHRNRVRASGKVCREGRVQGRPVRILDRRYMYDPVYAQQQAQKRARRGRVKVARALQRLRPGSRLYDAVERMLRDGIKADAIAGRLKLLHPENADMWVSHETIYQYAYSTPGCDWGQYFVKDRKKRKTQSKRRSQIPDRVSIKHRPEEVESRSVFGHWEGDTVVGHAGNPSKCVVATLTERKTRRMVAQISQSKSSDHTIAVITGMFDEVQEAVKTVTFDNGTEFTQHKTLTDKFGVDVYFADPYSSWQRGTNERHNGLLRRFFPKGTDFGNVTPEQLQEAVDFWNNYPRKILGYLTPNEAWEQELALLASGAPQPPPQ